ncbi:arsenate reductase (glutaredoxin) [Shimia haliotis]|uniref:Arsenate reductase n=1 Tax=Shimia haliotis TaxID=1280847 RepID=A0A1I4G590_9RHOB|nr:arsenate reductase (glutaredoxin) [Shimia haliotis]SFL24843.1 arsenate reductase [Shimia haliotis]
MIIIWHSPRCSKSRQTLALIEDKGEITIRRYLDDAPTVAEIEAVQAKLGVKAIEMMRPKEARFKELGLSKTDSDATLRTAMAENPILIERPIVITDTTAAIGRPPAAVLDIL